MPYRHRSNGNPGGPHRFRLRDRRWGAAVEGCASVGYRCGSPGKGGGNMKDWRNVLVSPETSIRETIRIMDLGALKIALVVDGELHLLGTVSDGDIRRGILKGCALED